MLVYTITSWDNAYVRATVFSLEEDWAHLKNYAKINENSQIQLLKDMKNNIERDIYDVYIWKNGITKSEAQAIINELTSQTVPSALRFHDLTKEIAEEIQLKYKYY